jgi:tetratricopeptide (TPR) repeat protein
MAPELPPALAEALQACANDPANMEAWDRAEDLAREHELPEPVLNLQFELLDGAASVEARVELGRRSADFSEEWFDDTERVLSILRKVLEVDRGARWAFERLSLLLTVAGRWEDLLAEYDRALRACDDATERVALLEEVARVARDFAGESHRANDYLKELLLLRPEDDQLAANLERRLEQQKRHQDLIDVWSARLRVLDTSAALATRVQIAKRYLNELQDAESALGSIEELLAAGGAEVEGCELLEGLAASATAPAATRRKALVILERLHRAAVRLEDVVRVLGAALLLAEDDAARMELHAQIAALLTEMGRPGEALGHCGSILRLAPENLEVHQQARELAARSGQHEVYADALVLAADGCEDGARRGQLLLEAAEVRETALGDGAAAIALYSRVLGDDGTGTDAHRSAARHLVRLLVEEGHKPQRLDVLERLAGLEADGVVQSDLLGEAAELARELGDAERSLRLWQRRLDGAPGDLIALSARIDLLESISSWPQLIADLHLRAEALGAQAKATPGEEGTERSRAARRDLVRIAELEVTRQNDLAAAIQVWKLLESRFGRDAESVDALVDLSTRAGRYDDVIDLLTAALGEEQEPARRILQHGRLGDAYRQFRGDAETAIAEYQRALELSPQDERARAGLRALLDVPEHAEAASEALAGALRVADEWRGLLDLVETRLTATREAQRRRDILLEAARIHEERGNDLVNALHAVQRAFPFDPSTALEAELSRLAEGAGDYEAAVLGYRKAAEVTSDETRLLELLMAQGALEETKLGRFDAALATFRRVLGSQPDHRAAAESLLRVAIHARQFEEAAWAFVEHCRALGAVPADLVALAEGLVGDQGPWDSAVDAFADRVATHDGLSERVAHDLKRQLAVWHRDRRNDPDSAEFVLRRAAKDYPDLTTLRMLAELQRRAPGRPLVQTLIAVADHADHELGALREAADVALTVERDVALAKPILERALEHASSRFRAAAADAADDSALGAVRAAEPAEVTAWSLERLVEIALGAGDRDRALALLVSGAELPFASERAVALRFRAAEIAARQADDSQAVELCRTLLELDPNHAGAIGLLSSLYERSGKLDKLLDLRRRELALNPPLERRLALRLDIAAVLGDLGGGSEQRLEALRANLDEEPGHADSVNALAQVLAGLERDEELATLLGEQAEAVARTGDLERAAALWARAGVVAEEKLGDVDRALSAFRSSVKLEPSLLVLDRLATICTARQEHLAAAGWLEQRFTLTPPSDTSAWRTTLASLATALVRADEEGKARQFLERGLDVDPAADDARRQLADLYRQGEDWQLLAPLLAQGVDYATSDAAKVEYLRSAAQVERRRLGRLEAAIPLLQRAVGLDPADRSLRLLLADGLLLAGRYDESRELLTALLEEFGRRRTKERASVHHHLAKIALATGDLDEALLQAEEASKIERTDPAILMLLAQVARQKGQLDRAEQAYRTLLLLVSRQAPLPSDEADAVGESTILFELYGIARDKGQADRARDLLDSALEVATREPAEAALLEEALRNAGQSDLLLQALDQRLAALGEGSSGDGAAAAQILVTKAQVLAKGGRLEEAFEARLAALERAPHEGRLLESTKKLADELGRAETLITHLSALAEQLAPRDARAAGELWLRLGTYTEAQPESLERAAGFYERAQQAGHKPIQCYSALDRVLGALGDDARMRRALERFVTADGAQADPEALTAALLRLAGLELGERSIEAGVAHLEQALALGARSDQGLELVQPLVRDGAREPALLRLFARVAGAADKATLLWALALAAELEDVSLELLGRAVDLARELEDGERLIPLLERTLEVGRRAGALGSVRWAVVELAEKRRSAGLVDSAAALLREAIDLCARAEEAEELAPESEEYALELRYAELAAGALGQIPAAIGSYERLLAVAPGDARVWRPLLTLYRKTSRTADQADLLERLQQHVTDPVELGLLRMERVRLMVEAGELESAESDLRAIIGESPSNAEAQAILADLLDRSGRRGELRELLESLHAAARDRGQPAEIAGSALRLARLVAQDDRREAIGVLTASLTWTSDSREVLTTLIELFTDEDDPAERADVMENLVQVESGAAAERLSLELADLRERLGDNYGAGKALELGFRVCPESEPLGERLRQWLSAQQDFGRLAEMLVVEAEHRPTEVALLRLDEAARLYAEELGDPLQAAETLSRALKRAPGEMDRLKRMVDQLVVVGEAERALTEIGAVFASVPAGTQAELARIRATLRANEYAADPGALEAAVEDLQFAIDHSANGSRGTVQKELVELLGRVRTLYADLADESGERRAVLRLAELLPEVGDTYSALETLAGWLREHPTDVECARRLGALSEAAEDWGTASFAYARLLDASQGEERRNAALRFADAAERAGTAMVARSALESVQRENPGDETLRQRLRQMYESAGAYAELGEILLNQADATTDPEEQFRLLKEAGELFLRAEVGGAACEIFQRALALKPDAYDVVFQLSEAYLALGEVDQAAGALEQAIEAHGKRRSPELSQLQHGLARVAYARGDDEGVMSWLEAALLTDRQNGEVAAELAVFAQERGRYETAVKALQLVTLLKTPCSMGRAEAYLRQAMIAEHQGDPKKAILLARRATAADPDYQEAQGFLAQLGG